MRIVPEVAFSSFVHACWVRHVGFERERAGRPDAVQGALRARGAGHRPAVAHQQLDDGATEVARSEHDRTSLLSLHLALALDSLASASGQGMRTIFPAM
jgi:hypothetical protein